MRTTILPSVLVFSLLSGAPPLCAMSVRAERALEHVGPVVVDILVGGSLGTAHKRTLFEGENSRATAFEERLKRTVEALLGEAGIEVDPEGEDFLGVGVWGHQEELDDGEIIAVFFVEITAIDEGRYPEAECEDDRDLTEELRVIGASAPKDLEEAIETEVTRLIKDMLPR